MFLPHRAVWAVFALLVPGLLALPAAESGELAGYAGPEWELAEELPDPSESSAPMEVSPSPILESPSPPAVASSPPPAVWSLSTPIVGERVRATAPPRAARLSSPIFVPVLLYHYIRVNPDPRDRVGFGLSTNPARFRSQMQYLASHGFHIVSLHEAVAYIRAGRPLPPRSVVLTFDDGYADFFEAAVPEMRKHGFTATVFVITGRIGAGGFLNWAQIRASDAMGFTIGAHTVDHVALASLPPARAYWQMQHSKLTLESGLGHTVLDFAYPYGSFNTYAQSAASKIGFETAVSTLIGSWHAPESLMYLSRHRVGGSMPLAQFARLVGGPPPTAADLAQ